MIWKAILAIGAVALLAAPAYAQPAPATPPLTAQTATTGTLRSTPMEPFAYQSAAEVDALTFRADGKPASKVVSDHENYFIEYVTRDDVGGNPEAHGHWYDYVHVLKGEGTITYGGTQDGGRDMGNQEIRGGVINGGKTITLHPGDRLTIPPGLPHRFGATKGNHFTYLIFKQRF